MTVRQAQASRLGRRVKFVPIAQSLVLYNGGHPLPQQGEVGEVCDVPCPGGRKKYLPGPGTGLLFVRWPSIGSRGIAPCDLEVA